MRALSRGYANERGGGPARLYRVVSAAVPACQSLRCWNWFEPRTRDGAGEAAAIATLVRDVARRYPVDPLAVYVAGISAGGADDGHPGILLWRHLRRVASWPA